jgi:hypothetical protein
MFSVSPSADHVRSGLAPGQRLHRAEHRGRARHVPFISIGGRLDRDAAG